jgi:AcrR family transcriptional regulator
VANPSEPSQERKAYSSELRRSQAEQTRRRVIQAARHLFASKGYSATSVHDLAAEAGVAVQTIYSSLGGKRGALLALNDLVDEEAEVAVHAGRLRQARDPRVAVGIAVRLTRNIAERCGDLVQAIRTGALTEPDMAEVLTEGFRRHRMGTRALARNLESHHALRHGVDAGRAAAILGSMTSVETWASMTGEHGWTFDETEAWLTSMLRNQLFGDPLDAPPVSIDAG